MLLYRQIHNNWRSLWGIQNKLLRKHHWEFSWLLKPKQNQNKTFWQKQIAVLTHHDRNIKDLWSSGILSGVSLNMAQIQSREGEPNGQLISTVTCITIFFREELNKGLSWKGGHCILVFSRGATRYWTWLKLVSVAVGKSIGGYLIYTKKSIGGKVKTRSSLKRLTKLIYTKSLSWTGTEEAWDGVSVGVGGVSFWRWGGQQILAGRAGPRHRPRVRRPRAHARRGP